jgi:glycosyltransferase involved in cell wall biosynthesis
MKVSIITPCFNSAKTIEATIKSVQSQTYSNVEHLIIDGGSTDGTIEVVNFYKRFNAFFISESDKGIYDAINKGIKLATGDIIGILNSDDRFYSSRSLEIIVEAFACNLDIDCVYGNLIFVDHKQKLKRKWLSRSFSRGLFEKSWTPAHPTFYCRKNVYSTIGFYKINYKIAADVELMYRVLELYRFRSFFVNEYLVEMRLGGVSTSSFRSTVLITKEIRKAFKENNQKLNLLKYLFFKVLKIKEYL